MFPNERGLSVEELLEKREVKKSEVLLAKLLKTDVDASERGRLLLLRARTRLLGSRFDDALADLDQARALNPALFDEPTTLEWVGDCHFARFEFSAVGFAHRNDTEYALAAYERILTEYPDYANSGWIFYQKGRVMLTGNLIHAAEICFTSALLKPSHVHALTAYCYERLGFIAFYEARELRTAVTFLEKAIATYPADEARLWLVQAHTLRSRILREMRLMEVALTAAEDAIQIAHMSNEGRLGLGDALLTTAETAAEIEGREGTVIQAIGQFLIATRKPVGVDVTYSRAHEMLGDAYLKTEQFALAASTYALALQFNPYHPWEIALTFRMARALYGAGDYGKTVAAVSQMLRIAEKDGHPLNDYRVYHMLGNACYALHRYEAAVDAYQHALTLSTPTSDAAQSIREYHYYALQRAQNPSITTGLLRLNRSIPSILV